MPFKIRTNKPDKNSSINFYLSMLFMNKTAYSFLIPKRHNHLCLKKMAVVLCIILYKPANSQEPYNNLGSWNIINLKYNYDKKWSFFAEAQLRSLKFYDDFHYYEYKGGITYNASQHLRISLGAGDYNTYRAGGNFVTPKINDEFRIWPQLQLTQPLGSFLIEQRLRAEFRFTDFGYRNRFRYRLGIMLPFGKEKNGFKPFMVSISDELFFTNREPYFERNRFQLAFNYKISKVTTLQAGYLHQFDYRINDEIGTDFLQIGLYLEFSRLMNGSGKKDREIMGD